MNNQKPSSGQNVTRLGTVISAGAYYSTTGPGFEVKPVVVDEFTIEQTSTLSVTLRNKSTYDLTAIAKSKGINLEGVSTIGSQHQVILTEHNGKKHSMSIHEVIAFEKNRIASGTPAYTYNDYLNNPLRTNNEKGSVTSAGAYYGNIEPGFEVKPNVDSNNPFTIIDSEWGKGHAYITLRNGEIYSLRAYTMTMHGVESPTNLQPKGDCLYFSDTNGANYPVVELKKLIAFEKLRRASGKSVEEYINDYRASSSSSSSSSTTHAVKFSPRPSSSDEDEVNWNDPNMIGGCKIDGGVRSITLLNGEKINLTAFLTSKGIDPSKVGLCGDKTTLTVTDENYKPHHFASSEIIAFEAEQRNQSSSRNFNRIG